MAKENTHLLIAERTRKQLPYKDLERMLLKHRDAYFLGSVFPDTFFYTWNGKYREISEVLHHGKDGQPTNALARLMLDYLLFENASDDDRAFVMGYLTHCAADIIIHPVLVALAGNHYDPDPRKRDRAQYLHSQIETALDATWNGVYSIHKDINPRTPQRLSILDRLSNEWEMPRKAMHQFFFWQRKASALIESPVIYWLAQHTHHFGLPPKYHMSLSYQNLKKDPRRVPEFIQYADLFSGDVRQIRREDLLQQAIQHAVSYLTVAYQYLHKEIGWDQARKTLRGEDLDTGVVGKTPKDIAAVSPFY